jgi:penicillin-binding protein 2
MLPEHHHIKNHQHELFLFRRRLIVCLIGLIALSLVLLFRFHNLQVTDYQKYVTESDRNRLQVRPLSPNRGLIFDKHHRIIAENRAVTTLNITVELVSDLEKTLSDISELVSISERERENFYKSLKVRQRPFEPVTLKFNLTEQDQARIAVNEYRLAGVEMDGVLVRHYPHKDLFAHVLGYVGRINERELHAFSEDDKKNYAGTRSIGKIGIEKFYEHVLHGEVGREQIEADARGRVIRAIHSQSVDPQAGQDIELFLDTHLQQTALDALAGRRGAVVAIEIETGGVLALLSAPSYDPNLFVTGISSKDYRALNQNRDLPLFNRAIQGRYPPGSTLKPMLGLGGLESGLVSATTKIADPGYFQLVNDERIYRDWKVGGHGEWVDMHTAIVESCDVYFYDLGRRLGVDFMHRFGEYFGLGEKTNIDIPSESRGLWPSRPWRKKERGRNWYPGDSLNMSIGQGDVLTTPLQLAVMTATLANKGKLIEPRVVAKIGNQETTKVQRSRYEGSNDHWRTIFSSMKGVVHEVRGTAFTLNQGMTFKMAGKTGTAQVVGIAQDEEYDSEALSERNRDHALFIGFAPADDPQIAVAVVIENGEKSSKAGRVAREVMQAYLEQDNGAG